MHFEEQQRFNQFWLWIILLGISFLLLYLATGQLVGEELSKKNPLPNLVKGIFVLLAFGFPIFFRIMILKTKINNNGISMHFAPFTKKEIDWSAIEKAEVINYGFVGGWGIRLGTKYGTVYNIRGNKGLALHLKNGKKFLIGTQKEQELRKVINQFYKNNFTI